MVAAEEQYRLNNYILSGPLRPVGNQVLIKPRKVEEKSAGGLLFVANPEVERPKEGLVVAAGPGKTDPLTGKLLANPVKNGDLVLLNLNDYTSESVEYNGEKHLFADAGSLLGTFDNQETTVSAFRPLGDRLLVEVPQEEEVTATGIAIAGAGDDDDANSGLVVAVGAGRLNRNGELEPVAVKPGESVMYKPRSGIDVNIEGKKFRVVSESNCFAKW